MRIYLYSILFILAIASQAQFAIKGIQNSHHRPLRTTAPEYPRTLPFWDDFSTSDGTPDTLLWITGGDVFVNATLGQNPPTYRVATFDGLKGNGLAHDIANGFNGPADSLISQPIDLSQVSNFKKTTVYLSFYWQAKGNGELPDEKDSIRVQFTTADSLWVTQWVQVGGPENVSDHFQQVIIPVSGNEFFHERFQFKFQAFSSLKGPFDTWHIDYVYLNQDRHENDLSHFDRSLSGSPSPLFSPYYEVPADHFFRDPAKYLSVQSVLATNLDAETAVGHPLDYYYQLENLTTGEVYDLSSMGNGGLGGLDPLEYRNILGPSDIDIEAYNTPLDSQVIMSTFYYETGDKNLFEVVNGADTVFLPVNLKVNDTIRTRYTLHNHYAYDDGTAEFAAAINLLKGQVAVKFALEAADTLTHVDIYFPNISPDPSGSSVDILVWDRLDDTRILSRQPYTIQSPTGLNQFTRIKLSQPVLTRDTVYVGYQQFTDNYLGVGFDRNNAIASNNIYTNVTGVWEQNTRLSGVLMIRPVFEFDSTFILSTPGTPLPAITAYPNPCKGTLSINGNFDQLTIFNLSGQTVYSSDKRSSYDLSFLEDGIYLLKINSNNSITTQKLIIRK